MEHRQLGRSGFKVPVLSLGTGTFGGGDAFFKYLSNQAKSHSIFATRLLSLVRPCGSPVYTTSYVGTFRFSFSAR